MKRILISTLAFAFMLSCSPKLAPVAFAQEQPANIPIMIVKKEEMAELYHAMPDGTTLVAMPPQVFNLLLQKMYECEQERDKK